MDKHIRRGILENAGTVEEKHNKSNYLENLMSGEEKYIHISLTNNKNYVW